MGHTRLAPPAAAWVVSLQGARNYAEDRVLAFPPFFAVVDGHGGVAAADELIDIMAERADGMANSHPAWWKLPSGPHAPDYDDYDDADGGDGPGQVRFDNACGTLASMHSDAQRRLASHRSGAVSLAAVAVSDAAASRVYFACVGDVQGCVFDAPADLPDAPVSRATRLHAFDMAQHELQHPNSPHPADVPSAPAGLALTAPHALRPPVTGWHFAFLHGTTIFGVPTGFEDGMSDREFRLSSRLIAERGLLDRRRLGSAASVPAHVPRRAAVDDLMRVQLTQGSGHARFLASVGPCRSLGDSECTVLAQPEIYAMRFGGAPRRRCLLLCSDGIFDGQAFPDMPGLAAFLLDPLAWICSFFYHPAQHLTRDLIIGRQLPERLPPFAAGPLLPFAAGPLLRSVAGGTPARHFKLINAWILVRAEGWGAVHTLFRQHLAAARRLNPRQPERWVQACTHSIAWFATHAADAPPAFLASPALAVHAAAHLAVIMGSHDNVSVLAAPVPPPAPLAAQGLAPISQAPDISPPLPRGLSPG